MKSQLLSLFIALVLCSVFSDDVHAQSGGGLFGGIGGQNSPHASPGINELWHQREEVTGKKDLSREFEGLPNIGSGPDKTPILIDKSRLGQRNQNAADRWYPEFARYYSRPTGHAHDWRSFAIVNLGVDDEVPKAFLANNLPLNSYKSDFSASTTIRDRHLNLFRTIRGIADLTLNYLDKTVAAGLNITQQGADTNATHHLLKQILWSVSKMANPRRTRIYEDTDEKLLACLMTNADPSRIGPDDQQISFDCPGVCGPRPVFSPVTGTGANRIGGGIIDYCVCCAEQSTIVNKSNPDSKVNGYSLVERLFFGRKKPDNHTYPKPGPSGTVNGYMTEVMEYFKGMYGDIIIEPGTNQPAKFGIEASNGNIDNAGSGDSTIRRNGEYMIVRTVLPVQSLPMKIDAMKWGKCSPYYTETASQNQTCLQNDYDYTDGVCRSFLNIIRWWGIPDDDRPQKVKDNWKYWWTEASLGKMLTARDINNIFRAFELGPQGTGPVPIPPGSSRDSWMPAAGTNLWLFVDHFCDSSATAALVKLHERMRAIIADHIELNRHVSMEEKQQLLRLMNRVDTHLAAAERDSTANWSVVSALTGVAIAADRIHEGYIASAAEARGGAFRNSSMNSTMTVFGAASQFCKEGDDRCN